MYIQSAEALQLSGFSDSDQFEAALMDGRVWLPLVVSVYIIRRLKRSNAAQPAQQREGGDGVPLDYVVGYVATLPTAN